MIDMDAYVKAVVDEAPPLSPEQIARLRVILCGSKTKEEAADEAA